MPGDDTVPSYFSRTHLTRRNKLWYLLVAVVIVGLGNVHYALGAVLAAAWLGPMASDWLASRRSSWVVYMLRNEHAEVIYVGQTDDTMRRMCQHTDGIEHVWWQEITCYTIWRHCWSKRQSKRIERRLVGVINRSADKKWCDKLRNEQYGNDHQRRSRNLGISTWKPIYLLASALWDCRSFTRPAEFTRSIPRRPEPHGPGGDDDLWADEDDWSSGSGWTEATYERRQDNQHGPVATLLALPPASCHTEEPVTPRHSHTQTPTGSVARDSTSHPPRRDTQPKASPDGATIRAAHQRQQAATITQLPADLVAHLKPEEVDALPTLGVEDIKKLRATLRQRKSRTQRAAAADQSPTFRARPRINGWGQGEGG